MELKTINEADIQGKKVILRAELDVPIKNGKVLSDTRLRANIPTIKMILENNAEKILIIGHLGRPKGFEEDKSLLPICKKLEKLLKQEVGFMKNFDQTMPENRIVLFENTRFFEGEEQNKPEFIKKLAQYGDIFINNCFSTPRDHASITGLAKVLPSYAGLRVIEETQMLSLDNKEHPIIAILGGAKLETKLPVIKALLPKVDKIILGGAMVLIILKIKEQFQGKILFDYKNISDIEEIMNNSKIVLPIDFACAKSIESRKITIKKTAEVNSDELALDIGPESTKMFIREIKNAKTIIWNGPLGYYEKKEFAKSSKRIAKTLAKSKAITLIGGGDTEDIIHNLKISKRISHICVGGSSMLKLLSGETLINLEPLKK